MGSLYASKKEEDAIPQPDEGDQTKEQLSLWLEAFGCLEYHRAIKRGASGFTSALVGSPLALRYRFDRPIRHALEARSAAL